MKYGIIYSDELIAIFNNQSDAEEMYLSLTQELEHKAFNLGLNQVHTAEEYIEINQKRFFDRYGSKEKYEQTLWHNAWEDVRHARYYSSRVHLKIVEAKYFE